MEASSGAVMVSPSFTLSWTAETALPMMTLPAVLNAANEVAVEAFCNRKIGFPQISEVVGRTMERHKVIEHPSLEQILAADARARADALLP